MERVQLLIPKPIRDNLEREAKERDYSFSELVRSILQKHVDAREKQQ